MASKDSMPPNNPAETTAVDAEVLAGCRAGQRSAQQRLYELCHRQVFRLMVRMVGLQDAADVTQQVFLQLLRRIDQFEGYSKFETWLYRLAMNEALQHLRKGQRWKFRPIIQEPMSRHQPDGARNEHRELLERAMERLEPELRGIFVLREVDGLSYHEIGEALDIPEGTVGSRLNRARRELQRQLTELGWEP